MLRAVRELDARLAAMQGRAGDEALDVRWLRVRCKHTLLFRGRLRDDSYRDLVKDLDRYCDEFPDLFPRALHDALAAPLR